jgi:hypothetical protein
VRAKKSVGQQEKSGEGRKIAYSWEAIIFDSNCDWQL